MERENSVLIVEYTLGSIVENDDREVIVSKIPKIIPQEKITYFNGEEHWLSTIKVPLFEDDGSCKFILGVSSDITYRKKIEEDLFKMKKHWNY